MSTRACIKRYFGWAPWITAIDVMGALEEVRGSVDRAKFIHFLEENLVPFLQPFNQINHNSIVVMGAYTECARW